MENLIFERREKNSPEGNIRPMKEVPILTKEDREEAIAKIGEEKINKSETDPHWGLINPDNLKDADIYSYYRTFVDKLEPWESEECEDFMDYAGKINKYLEEEYGTGSETMRREDSRNNLYGLIRSHLVAKGAWKKRMEKNKGETIH